MGAGYAFVSRTDSEVIAHLVEECYEGDLRAAVAAALEQLEGTYGIAVISSRHPGTIIAARRQHAVITEESGLLHIGHAARCAAGQQRSGQQQAHPLNRFLHCFLLSELPGLGPEGDHYFFSPVSFNAALQRALTLASFLFRQSSRRPSPGLISAQFFFRSSLHSPIA